MSLRQIELFLPKESADKVEELLQEQSIEAIWQSPISEEKTLVKIILSSQQAEEAIDTLSSHFSSLEDFRIILLPVSAYLTHPSESESSDEEDNNPLPEVELDPESSRLNRQELQQQIDRDLDLNLQHIVMLLISAIIAVIGLLRDDSTIIIGAMVIAPLLGPNMGLSLATTLGDMPLAKKALQIGAFGISLALALSLMIGFFIPINLDIPEIALRTRVRWSDVLLAFASGIAGALSFTSGTIRGLVGVMVSVALLPPLVTFGMLLGSGRWEPAVGAMLLFFTNLVCLNLAGVLTFSLQNIRPGEWWLASKAEKATNAAYFIWFGLLFVVITSIVFWRRTHWV
ncbi:TIGR00341 family protein [Phormidium pseudopriestleyi FRX01]|uniref:TIGR00341 family protein n=1 Tax=Phormidium pseudopriestleyi FRX01 TaxID=1759528 RepID=A0ABS3FL45_9CYAN|nr:TIGR00341 family protein [Phormidium pseudopriestleyi]MBO0347558.1 TIGR00341 family protein [Phormidium pseudopriestleyi FRX01]